MSTKVRLAAALALIVSMFSLTLSASAYHDGSDQYHPIANDEFEEVWERTDYPVQQTVVARTWIWGPAGFSDLMTEEYDDAEGGERQVQYFDKSRMEENGDVDDESPWSITQGRLAYELMTGDLQLGDEEEDFEQHQPSQRSAAGDPDDDTAPTYAAMGGLMDEAAHDEGETITEFADHQGNVTTNEDLADFGVTAEYYVSETDHTIASVFWDFMNSQSTIYEDGEFVTADLFQEDGFYAIGFPLTEAYWAWAEVDGEEQHVLIQCFERRCLTYTPGNPDGWEVESGNIGQHYYDWRYNQIDRDAPTAGSFSFNGEQSAAIDIGESIDLTAHVTSHGDDAEGVSVGFHVIGGDNQDAVSLSPSSADTGADGTADVTVTGEEEGTAEVQAFADLDEDGVYDFEEDLGLGLVEVTVSEVSPELTLDASGMNLDVGESGEVLSSLTNPAAEDGGIDYSAVRNNIIVDGPVDCGAGDDWNDWFTITDVNNSGDTQGINDTFVCDEDSGDFVGYWGPELGFALDAGATADTTFDVMVSGSAPAGAYTITGELVDVDADVVLASASDDFDITD